MVLVAYSALTRAIWVHRGNETHSIETVFDFVLLFD